MGVQVMFEISGNDVTQLSDVDLRSLVARLALAELRTKGHPLSSVTAGGNQDAADGGLDVRVECPSDITDPDFVPRRLTGFQVKKPDMPVSAILAEMRPKGVLREVIRELTDASGAYIIVSSQGSVADKPLRERRKAMRAALEDLPNAAQLHTDFYDRERLATWVNEYPGIAAWMRKRIGRPLSGWSSVGDWESGGPSRSPYLSDDKACLIDEGSRDHEHLPIAEGIDRLREALNTPQKCIRLVGLSGLGKTRLIQALFEEGVGGTPLDSSLAVYTDYSEETDPTARDMARELIAQGQRAILMVDNCNPGTHSELARLCSSEGSKISLITVEYDVRDDEPELTEVFRLQSASTDLVSEWLKQNFPDISQVDRGKIAEFSDGNFRVASALADTLGKGETLGSLRNQDLFERIFYQRNQPDRELLQSAEDLSLLYSIDGEDATDSGELARVGIIRGLRAQLFYERLVELRKRGVVQARGRFRAILPQALANPLAAHALDRIPSIHFDKFCRSITPRMLKSVSRRLGLLHDSQTTQSTVARWLQPDGPLGNLIAMGDDGLQIITNIAPVAPEDVLAKFEQEFHRPSSHRTLAPRRNQWIRLIKAISYDSSLFERCVTLIAQFLPENSEQGNNDSGLRAFSESFQIYLSGTQASPAERREVIRRFAASDSEVLRGIVPVALRAFLKSGSFMSLRSFDFGARSRDWGWRPKTEKEIWDWFEEAIELVVELSPPAQARILLANGARTLWRYAPCRDALDRIATVFSKDRPWIEGWIAFRAILRHDGEKMPVDVRERLKEMIRQLRPLNLLDHARALVLNRISGDWDFHDGEEDKEGEARPWEKARSMAKTIGHKLAKDTATRVEFLPELLAGPHADRAFYCGIGLAEGADDLNAIWLELSTIYGATKSQKRNQTVLCGFISEAHLRDQSFTSHALDAAIKNPNLLPIFPYLQGSISMDAEGIGRLRRAISEGGLVASNLSAIANGKVSKSPPKPLADLLEDIADLPGGVIISLDILQMYLHDKPQKDIEKNSIILSIGRKILVRLRFSDDHPLLDYGAGKVVSVCLAGEDGQNSAVKVCENIRSALEVHDISPCNLTYTLNALLAVHPYAALDTFLLPNVAPGLEDDLDSRSPIETLDDKTLEAWATADPNVRYPILGDCLSMFGEAAGEEKDFISPLFLSLLKQAPDKRMFLGDWWRRLHPRSSSGSRADILSHRKVEAMKLAELRDGQISAWLIEEMPKLDQLIEHERARELRLERAREESFE